MLYFAYGSNMDPEQMRSRCPGAKVVGIGFLADHVLCFPRRSTKRGCGVSSVEPKHGHRTWGVLYELTAEDLVALDKSEGYRGDRARTRNAYNRVATVVNLNGEDVATETYIAEPQEGVHLPNETYLAHIHGGAVHHRLPDDYVGYLSRILSN